MSLVTLSYLVSFFLILLGLLCLIRPKKLSLFCYRFLDNECFGTGTLFLGGIWFLWEVSQLSEADFGQYKIFLIVLFSLLFISCWMYWKDWLSVRGLSLISLLLMHQCLGVGYMQTAVVRPWISLFCYVIIIAALFFGTYPYRAGDFFKWSCERAGVWPIRCLGGFSLFYGLFIVYMSTLR